MPTGQPVPPSAFGPGGGSPRGGRVAIALGILAVLLAGAALVVALVRGGQSSTTAATTAQPSTSVVPAADTSAADKSLCEAVAPLLRESADEGKAFVNLGHTGTPERDAAIPGYRAQVEDWVSRIQPMLDTHADPPRYMTRMLQQLIDYTRSYAENIQPGPATEADEAAWNNRVVAYGGPFEVCHKLGVNW
jgi:hypothetical protein